MLRSFRQSRRGSVITVFAFSTMVLAVLTALVVDQVGFYIGKRKLQAAADLAALMMMRSGVVTDAQAKALVTSQIADATGLVVTVTKGRYTPDGTKAVGDRFVAGALPWNAIQVDATIPTKGAMMAGMLPSNTKLTATARAARRQTASIAVGSRLVRLEGGLSQALLNTVLGYKGKVTVMDYNALASAQVDAAKFIKELNTKASINAVTFDDVLKANVTVGQVIQALASTVDSPSVAATLKLAAPLYPSSHFKLADVVDIGSISALPLDALTGGDTVPLNVGELLAASAALSNGDHQVALDLSALSAANVALDIGEKPQVLRYDAYAEPNTKVETSQLNLSIGALGVAKVDVGLASAEVTLDQINCKTDGTTTVTLKAKTKAAEVGLKVALLPKITVAAGSDETKTLTFSSAEIAAQTWKPTRSGLGLQVGSLSVAQKLLFKPVDDLLVALGLNVAEADVKVIDADCGAAGLVQ